MKLAIGAPDWVMMAVAVAAHPLLRLAVTVYVPADKPLTVAVVAPPGFQLYDTLPGVLPTSAVAEPPEVFPQLVLLTVVVSDKVVTGMLTEPDALHGPMMVSITVCEPALVNTWLGLAKVDVLAMPDAGSPKFQT